MAKVKGCVHVHVKDGRIVNIFSHLSEFPDDCVIHLKPDEVLTQYEFNESHPKDREELKAPPGKVHDLGDSGYTLEI